jgi:hypothetical protein
MGFDALLDSKLASVINRPDIFGRQILLGENDEELGEEPRLLHAAADIGIDDLPGLAASYGGVAVPAHIDRASNGLIAILGFVPEGFPYGCYEVRDQSALPGLLAGGNPGLAGSRMLHSSDAHCLAAIQERGQSVSAAALTAAALVDALRSAYRA